jgi:hypothetical protein
VAGCSGELQRLLDDLAVAVTQQVAVVVLLSHRPVQVFAEQLAEDAEQDRLVIGQGPVEVEDHRGALGGGPVGYHLTSERWHRHSSIV